MANRIQLRRDTTANWENTNPVLADGEMGYDIVTNEIRIGNGSNTWSQLSANTISGGGGASTGNVTFNGINIIGNDNLRFQPNATVTDGYIDVYLTVGPDIHVVASNSGNLILGPDSGANVRISGDGNVQVRAQDIDSTSTWTFNPNGNLTLPEGGVIAEGGGITGAIRLTPSGGANANQALLIYPTAGAPEGDHVHLTAGGGSTELYLGNDLHYVKLVDGGNIELRAATANLSSQAAWTFDTTGNIDTIQALGIKVPDGVPTNVAIINSTTGSWEMNPNLSLVTTGGSGSGLTVNVAETGGFASTIEIATAGTGYTNGDLITVTSGTSNATFTIVIGGRNTWRFGTDGTLTLPRGGGAGGDDEGAEIAFTRATTSSLAGDTVIVDQYVNRLRFFESGGGTRGAYIDLTYGANNAGTLLNNRVSGFVNAGANVIMDSLKATVTTSDERGLSLAATTGSFSMRIAGTYANAAGTGGSMTFGTITTTPSASLFGWNFTGSGDMATYIITDTTNTRAYRITMQIGDLYDNNLISIERLV
jgi:hypothetical protein